MNDQNDAVILFLSGGRVRCNLVNVTVPGLSFSRFDTSAVEEAPALPRHRVETSLRGGEAKRFPPLEHLVVIGALSLLLWTAIIAAAAAILRPL